MGKPCKENKPVSRFASIVRGGEEPGYVKKEGRVVEHGPVSQNTLACLGGNPGKGGGDIGGERGGAKEKHQYRKTLNRKEEKKKPGVGKVTEKLGSNAKKKKTKFKGGKRVTETLTPLKNSGRGVGKKPSKIRVPKTGYNKTDVHQPHNRCVTWERETGGEDQKKKRAPMPISPLTPFLSLEEKKLWGKGNCSVGHKNKPMQNRPHGKVPKNPQRKKSHAF